MGELVSVPILFEKVDKNRRVRILFKPNARFRFVVQTYSPESDWVHNYQCNDLRKALHRVDMVHLEEFW